MQALTRIALRFPGATATAALLLTLVALAGLPRTRTEVGYRAILGERHPAVQRLDRLIETFAGGLPVMAVWSCGGSSPCDSVFDEASLRMAEAVERELGAHPLVGRVESPASAPLLTYSDGGLEIRRMIENGAIPEDVGRLAEIAVGEPLWRGTLVSDDGRVGALIVQLASSDSETTASIVPALQAALAPHEAKGFAFALVGDPVDFVISGGEMQRETPRMIPVMVVLVGLVIVGLFRSWMAAALALGTAGLAVGWAMGTMAWLGWPQMELTQPLPAAVLVVGVCAALHVLSRYAARIAPLGPVTLTDREREMHAVSAEVGLSCLICSLTTAAGFLSFTTSGLDSFLRFGVIVAWGVMVALALTFTLLPVVLVRISPRLLHPEAVHAAWEQALQLLVGIAQRRARPILIGTILVLAVSLLGVLRVRIDVNEQELLGDKSPVVQWARFVDDHLRKADSLEIELEAPPGGSMADPEAMAVLSSISEHLPAVDGLGRVVSILDLVSPLNQLLHDNDPSYRRPADTRSGNAQLLLALRASTDAADHWLDFQDRRARLSVEADPISVERRAELLRALTAYLGDTLPEGWSFTLTGPLAVYTDFVEEIQRTQLRSFSTAFVVIGAVLFAFLWATRSPPWQAAKLTGVALAASVLPVVLTIGAMGWLDVPLDVGTAMVAAIVLGIAVDDSVHLIGAYRARRRLGGSRAESIRTAVERVGRAAVTTSLALSVGFFTLMMSSWQSIASFGFLAGVAILGALVADLLVLPALILGFAPGESPPYEPPEISEEPGTRERVAVTLLVVVVAASTYSVATTGASSTPEGPRLGCPLAQHGHVAVAAAFDPRCPLDPHDRIDYLEHPDTGERFRPRSPGEVPLWLSTVSGTVPAAVIRHGTTVHREIPVIMETATQRTLWLGAATLLTAAMMALGLFVLWTSSARAAVPFAMLYAAVAVLAMYVLASPAAQLTPAPWLMATGLLPAIIVHLALDFPHPRSGMLRSSGFLAVCYGAGAVIGLISVWVYGRYPGLWKTVFSLSGVVGVACWLVLLVALGIARKELRTQLERARANATLLGTLVLPAMALLVGGVGQLPGPFVATIAAAVLPLPMGYALARYQRHDMRPGLRESVSYIVFSLPFVGAVALALYAYTSSADSSTRSKPGVLATLFLLLLAAHLLGDRLWMRVKAGLPTLGRRLQSIETVAAHRLRELQNEDDVSQVLADLIQEALRGSAVSVHVATPHGWRLAAACGEDPPGLAPGDGLPPIGGTGPVDLGIEGGVRGPAADRLRRLGVAVLLPLCHGSEPLALALIRAPRAYTSYGSREIDFLARLGSFAGVALRNARLSDELLRVERFSTIGRIATALMHDIGKPITVIRQDAKELLRNETLPADVREAARSTVEQSEDALETIHQLLDRAREGLAGTPSRSPLRDIIERAVEAVGRRHGEHRIGVRLDPSLPALESADELRVALVNLLDNALLATHRGEPAEIRAGLRGSRVRIQVIDRGGGMSREVRERAFEPFFTTRGASGGRGIGLSATRDIVERLGGRVALESAEGMGTTVTIDLPLG